MINLGGHSHLLVIFLLWLTHGIVCFRDFLILLRKYGWLKAKRYLNDLIQKPKTWLTVKLGETLWSANVLC